MINIPIISAAMDTVTESKMAIAMAREGGIGFIHKNMSIEKQVKEIDIVKRTETGMIINPVNLREYNTTREAEQILKTYRISGLPVVDENNTLIGIITNRDIKYLKTDDTPVTKIVTKDNLITGTMQRTLEEAKTIIWNHRIEKLPIVDKDYKLMGSIPAMKRGSADRYFQENNVEIKKLVTEGIEGRVTYKGALRDTLYQLIGGVKSVMGYCGTKTILDLQENYKFVRVNGAGLIENHPHDIVITTEAPNYSKGVK
jgi:IMP dehydrogenase/GMP reductase